MRAPNVERNRSHALGWLLMSVACTAQVDDDNPFATVGMSGATMAMGEATTADGSSGSEPTDTADESATGPGEGSTSEDGGDASTGPGDTAGDCTPACDPLAAICEGGQCVPPGPPLPGQVVITELMPNPAAVTDDDGEWIELTNVSDAPVDLEGCVLYDAANDEDVVNTGAPIVVPPGGLVLFAKTADAVVNGGLPSVAYAFGTSYTLANTGDQVRLECGGAVIDELTYVEAWPFAEAVAMQLSSDSLDATANDAPGSWCPATAAYGAGGDQGTPGQANGGC